MSKSIRVRSFVFKFVDLCRKSCDVNNWDLMATDVSRTERMWIMAVQEDCFEVDIQSLQGHGIAMFLQKQLNLFLDHEGVIGAY